MQLLWDRGLRRNSYLLSVVSCVAYCSSHTSISRTTNCTCFIWPHAECASRMYVSGWWRYVPRVHPLPRAFVFWLQDACLKTRKKLETNSTCHRYTMCRTRYRLWSTSNIYQVWRSGRQCNVAPARTLLSMSDGDYLRSVELALQYRSEVDRLLLRARFFQDGKIAKSEQPSPC